MDTIKQVYFADTLDFFKEDFLRRWELKEYNNPNEPSLFVGLYNNEDVNTFTNHKSCLLYTSPSPRDRQKSRMPSSA